MNVGFNVRTVQSDEWQTPAWMFDALDGEFGFTMDGASTDANALVTRHSTLERPLWWTGERVYCNPPYSDIMTFVKLAFTAQLAVLVLPVRTDSDWHRVLCESGRVELRYWRKRVKFLRDGVEIDSPRFASLIAVVRGE